MQLAIEQVAQVLGDRNEQVQKSEEVGVSSACYPRHSSCFVFQIVLLDDIEDILTYNSPV